MAMPKVREAMIKIRNEILRSILNLPGRMVQVGIDIVKGIWRGIKQRAGQLKQDVANFAQGIVDTVTAKLKIKSPKDKDKLQRDMDDLQKAKDMLQKKVLTA